MRNEKYDYRRSDLYRMWMDESGLDPEPMTADTREALVATEGRIAGRILALVEYARRAVLRSEESCLEPVNLGRASQLAASVIGVVRDLSCDTVVQMLDIVKSNALEIEEYLQLAGATISEEHNLQQLFLKRDHLRSA